MPRKQSARKNRDSSEPEDPEDILFNAQHKMTELRRNLNRRQRIMTEKHAKIQAKVKERIDSRLTEDQQKIIRSREDMLVKWQEAMMETMAIENQIREKIDTLRKECMKFATLLKVVIEGRKQDAENLDLAQLQRDVYNSL
ncbi:hypothetical protein SAPIO_CDS3541 [Scedosporium apiospermum]|uniref:Uncharacterized protein n=1 Tax=Pseudallescheria apiosperma TaxID=563466 RepID=A0A084GB09_PSEDA|nr:uncharacterized protein SAPIO_CDS3541 [Scedosporium apiospermum]KEZ44521.1 hypothetical protein SAPIO_CDS3541 [Scedosporium apiospermum]